MAFGDISWEDTLPKYLLRDDKNRLKDWLSQFFKEEQKEINYNDFFLYNPQNIWMQSDILHSNYVYEWDHRENKFETGFAPVMIISNSCDISEKENRIVEKEALFAQVIPLNEYLEDLKIEGVSSDNIKNIYNGLRKQTYTNLFYLPPNKNDNKEYIVFFDKIYWNPTKNLYKKLIEIDKERYLSLSLKGFYLFICKLSYHFCRVPEEIERF